MISAFPNGGGAYAVGGAYLGKRVALVAAASLIIDYILNVAVSVSAGVAALTSAYPALYGDRVWLCLAVLALITAVNLRGVAESARLFMVPTVLFIVAIGTVIVAGLLRSHPAAAPASAAVGGQVETVGVLLLLKAFASGCSALTGVEAIANAVPTFRAPRVKRAQRTEVALGALLAVMLLGLAVLIKKFHVAPDPSGKTVLAQLTDAALGHNVGFFAVQFVTMILLALAANISFGGMPVLGSLLAHDNYVPHVFALRADRQVHRYGVFVLARLRAVLRRRELRSEAGASAGAASYTIGPSLVDLATRTVTREGENLRLTRTEWAVPDLLVRHPDQLVTIARILAEVWGKDATADWRPPPVPHGQAAAQAGGRSAATRASVH